jgi:hypothetical protein
MNVRHLFFAGAALLVLDAALLAQVRVVTEHSATGAEFAFKSVPPPANNDAATEARFTIVDGQRDTNGGELLVLHDGHVPIEEDQPSANFFFRAGTDGGRIQIDLGRPVSVKQVGTYSWHPGTRAPQVYTLYAAEDAGSGFDPTPKRGTSPELRGWKAIASVDTRPGDGEVGGQHGVLICGVNEAPLGTYRYLLFDIERTQDSDPFSNTFYSEIDVLDASGPPPTTFPRAERAILARSFDAEEGKYHFTIDATAAPDLMEWADKELRPVVVEWYPKLVAMLPSDGFQPRTNVTLRFRNDMGGTPASASGDRINMNSSWFRKELKREARGAVVHEMVHVIQNYGRVRRTDPDATRPPGWLVEGIADYIRWFLFEPETRGAEITRRNLARANYDASYRITGNFLDWVTKEYDSEIVRRLNAAARDGMYKEQLWVEYTGKTVQQLNDEWIKANEARLGGAAADTAPSH